MMLGNPGRGDALRTHVLRTSPDPPLTGHDETTAGYEAIAIGCQV